MMLRTSMLLNTVVPLVLLLLLQVTQAVIVEPWIENIRGLFGKEECKQIIEAAETFGFPNTSDSIDYNEPRSTVSWAIDVVLEQMIEVPEIASIYNKYLGELRDIVADRKFRMNDGDTSEPTLDWVFLRKYSAGEKRRMLKLHHDINLFTVNIALNDDFEGGGLFYHKNDDTWFHPEGMGIPTFPHEKLNYEYLEKIKRVNSTDIAFPDVKTGDVLIHNHSLFHAIAPLEKGTRYSLVFFYDMHHPAVAFMSQVNVKVTVENHFDFPVDLVVIDNLSVDGINRIPIQEDLPEDYTFDAIASLKYEVYDRERKEIVFDFTVYDDKAEGEMTYVYVGPDREEEGDFHGDALDKIVVIENYFPYPVDLYWLDNMARERVLMEENLGKEFGMDTKIGHEFEILKQDTSEILHYIEILEPDEDGEYIFVVGPEKEEQLEAYDDGDSEL